MPLGFDNYYFRAVYFNVVKDSPTPLRYYMARIKSPQQSLTWTRVKGMSNPPQTK